MSLVYLLGHRKRPKPPVIPVDPELAVYGVKIDTTNPETELSVTYTDQAIGKTPARGNNGNFSYGSWRDVFPFNEMRPCILKNGIVQRYLNKDNYTLDAETNEVVDITDLNAGDVMIEFPKFYFKIEKVGTDLFVKYSKSKVDDSFKAYGHTRGSVEKDHVYIGAYFGTVVSNVLRSSSDKNYSTTMSLNGARTYARANGDGYEVMSFYQITMIQVLYLIMFKSLNSQIALGMGSVSSSPKRSGTADSKTFNYGSTFATEQVKLFGIEGFYGNLWQWVDGIYAGTGTNLYIGTDNFNDTGTGYTLHPTPLNSNLTGYIKGVQGTTETGFVIGETGGSATTYFPDNGSLQANNNAQFGGQYNSSYISGVFNLQISISGTTVSSTRGSRLMYL